MRGKQWGLESLRNVLERVIPRIRRGSESSSTSSSTEGRSDATSAAQKAAIDRATARYAKENLVGVAENSGRRWPAMLNGEIVGMDCETEKICEVEGCLRPIMAVDEHVLFTATATSFCSDCYAEYTWMMKHLHDHPSPRWKQLMRALRRES